MVPIMRITGAGVAHLQPQIFALASIAQYQQAFSSCLQQSPPLKASSTLVARTELLKPSRSFSHKTNDQDCTVTLYTNIGQKWTNIINLSCSGKETVNKVKNMASVYFGITKKWDKNLINTILCNNNDLGFDWFELTKQDGTVLGVSLSGNRSIFFKTDTKESYAPLKKPYTLSVALKILSQKDNYEIGYKEIPKDDLLMAAFFNSSSFKDLKASNSDLAITKTIKNSILN